MTREKLVNSPPSQWTWPQPCYRRPRLCPGPGSEGEIVVMTTGHKLPLNTEHHFPFILPQLGPKLATQALISCREIPTDDTGTNDSHCFYEQLSLPEGTPSYVDPSSMPPFLYHFPSAFTSWYDQFSLGYWV